MYSSFVRGTYWHKTAMWPRPSLSHMDPSLEPKKISEKGSGDSHEISTSNIQHSMWPMSLWKSRGFHQGPHQGRYHGNGLTHLASQAFDGLGLGKNRGTPFWPIEKCRFVEANPQKKTNRLSFVEVLLNLNQMYVEIYHISKFTVTVFY